jgi:hypothetical protein
VHAILPVAPVDTSNAQIPPFSAPWNIDRDPACRPDDDQNKDQEQNQFSGAHVCFDH